MLKSFINVNRQFGNWVDAILTITNANSKMRTSHWSRLFSFSLCPTPHLYYEFREGINHVCSVCFFILETRTIPHPEVSSNYVSMG